MRSVSVADVLTCPTLPGRFSRLVAGVILVACLAPGLLWGQEVSTQTPKEYERFIRPMLTDGLQVVRQSKSVQERVNSGEGGSVLLAESIVWVAEDGRLFTVQHDIYRANTEEMVESVARVEVGFRRSEQRVSVALARTLLADGTSVPVRTQSMFIQTPQDRADEALYTDSAELVMLFPQVTAGAAVEYVVVTEQAQSRIAGEFTSLSVFQYYWPVDVLRRLVELPADMASRLRLTEVGEPVPVAQRETLRSGRQRLTWERRGVPSYEPASWAAPLSSQGPALWLSTLESWEALADWYRGLLVGRDELPPELARQVDGWTADLEEPIDIVRVLHQKVADDIRYTGLEFGIGGLQPRPPMEVWHDRFGDCKDKANLLRAFLAHKGIHSYLVLVNTEHDGAVETRSPDYRHFNHAILGIELTPGSRRLLYADPTAAYLPPGVLGRGDVDRPVLVIRDQGYQFTRTPDQSAGVLDLNFDLEVRAEGVAGWLRLHVTGSRSAAYRRYFHDGELWQKRQTVEGYLDTWFPDIEVVDVETVADDGKDGEATFVLRAYFLDNSQDRDASFAKAAAGETALPLLMPDPWQRDSAEELEEKGRGLTYLDILENRIHVRYRLPEGWSATSVPGHLGPPNPSAAIRGSWTCEPGRCSAEVVHRQNESKLDESGRKALAKELRALEDWLSEHPEVTRSAQTRSAQTPTTALAEADSSSGSDSGAELEALDLGEFPRLTSAAGQLLLIDRKFPADVDPSLRRAALSKLIEWFPETKDVGAVFEAKIWQADLDCDAEDPAGGEAMQEIIVAAGPEVSADTKAWGSYLRALCSTVPRGEARDILRRLAEDQTLSKFRRFWSAYSLADELDEAGEPADVSLGALSLTPGDLESDQWVAKAVLETWLRSAEDQSEDDLRGHIAPYLEGDAAGQVVARLTESLQRWESNGAGERTARIYAALDPLLSGRDDLAEEAAALHGLGLSAADADQRAAVAREVAAILASGPAPEWWGRITVAQPDNEAALSAKTKELGQTQLAAEYLRHLGELVVRYPQRDDFGEDLWRFAHLFDKYFPQEPIGGALAGAVAHLPASDSYRQEAVFLAARRIERLEGGEAALALIEKAIGDPSSSDRVRAGLIYQQGRVQERMGRNEEALETYALLAPMRNSWIRAIDADLRRALLYLEAGQYEAALALAGQLAEVADGDVEKADSPAQIRGLVKLYEAPQEAMAFWRSHDAWFADWRALAGELGWQPEASQQAPELGDQTQFGGEIGAAIQVKNLQGFLGLMDTFLRAVRWDPSLVPDAGYLLQKGDELAPKNGSRFQSVAADVLSTVPLGSSPIIALELSQRVALLRAGVLVDSERFEELGLALEEFFATARPEGDTYRRMRLMASIMALQTGEGQEEAAAGLVAVLVPEWSDSSRGLAVDQLAQLYFDLGRTQDELDLLERELEVPATRDSVYGAELRERLESRRAQASGLELLEASLRDWRRDEAPPWLEWAEPQDLSSKPWDSKPVSEWLEDDDLPATQKLKIALLVGLSAESTAVERREAVAGMPALDAEASGWHRARSLARLETWLDAERWDEDVQQSAMVWLAVASSGKPELQERVNADPRFQKLTKGFHEYVHDQWREQDILRGPPSGMKEEIEALLAKVALDDDEADRLESCLQTLAQQAGPEPVRAFVPALGKLRLQGEEHGGERLGLEMSRALQRMDEDRPLHEAVRARLATWPGRGGEPDVPDEWWDLNGFIVTSSVLPAAKAEEHFLYHLETTYVSRESAARVIGRIPLLDDGTDAWFERYQALLESALTNAPDDDSRAELLRAPARLFRRYPEHLNALLSAGSAWRRDVDAKETRATLRLIELYLAGLSGDFVDWQRELSNEELTARGSTLRSLQILDLAAHGRKDDLAKILRDRSVEDLLDPESLDDHLIAALAAGDEQTLDLLKKVARVEIDKSVLQSWASPSGIDAEWALKLAEILGESGRIPGAWIQHQNSTLRNEAMLAEVNLYDARRRGDWPAVGEAARTLHKLRPGNVDLDWDLARSAHAAGDDAAAKSHLEAFLASSHNHWQYQDAEALCRSLGCTEP